MDARKDHLRAGRPSIDADTVEHDIVCDPERILLDWAIEEFVVVIVIGIGPVFVKENIPVFVIRQGCLLYTSTLPPIYSV